MNDTVKQSKIYQSESIKDLSAALAKAQSEMKHAEKAMSNSFFKSKYADLPAVMDAARPYLSKNGLAVMQLPEIDDNGNVILGTLLSHSSGEWVKSWYPVKPVKQDPQGLGSAITYARRYAYCCMVGVAPVDEDDDGNAASNRKESGGKMKARFEEIKKAILDSNDPGATWHENLIEINEFLEQDKTFYDDLVSAGARRRAELIKGK